MHSHNIDASYLNNLYNFWSNLLFGDDDKTESATRSQKPAESASSYDEDFQTNAGAAGFSPGAAMYYGNSQAALAKHSMHFKVLNLAATFVAGFLNLFTGKGDSVTEPPTHTNYAMACNEASIPPDNIELRHRSMRDQSASGCTHSTSKQAKPKVKGPKEPECRAAYIPFEAIEYRYGTGTGGIMHLPICTNG